MSDIGHNSNGAANEQLKSFVERIERLEEEKTGLTSDIRDIYTEAKSSGFNVQVMRQVVRLRKMDAAKRQEREAVLDLYLHALGMLAGTPLGEAALRREFGASP